MSLLDLFLLALCGVLLLIVAISTVKFHSRIPRTLTVYKHGMPTFTNRVTKWEVLPAGTLEIYGLDDDDVEIKLCALSPDQWDSCGWPNARTEIPPHVQEDLHA